LSELLKAHKQPFSYIVELELALPWIILHILHIFLHYGNFTQLWLHGEAEEDDRSGATETDASAFVTFQVAGQDVS